MKIGIISLHIRKKCIVFECLHGRVCSCRLVSCVLAQACTNPCQSQTVTEGLNCKTPQTTLNITVAVPYDHGEDRLNSRLSEFRLGSQNTACACTVDQQGTINPHRMGHQLRCLHHTLQYMLTVLYTSPYRYSLLRNLRDIYLPESAIILNNVPCFAKMHNDFEVIH